MNTRHPISRVLSLLGLLLLAACTPATYAPYPPETPILYPASYDQLFDTTLKALASTYVPTSYSRLTFAISSAEKETGLIRLRREDLQTAWLRQGEVRIDDERLFIDLDRAYYLTVESLITLVLRPEGPDTASLVYSTSNSWGTSSEVANAFMARVIAKLDAEFLAPDTSDPLETLP
jgi:hypothetical protein